MLLLNMVLLLRDFDLQTAPKLNKEAIVGRKVAMLKPLLRGEAKYIPDFFVVTTKVFKDLFEKIYVDSTLPPIDKVRQYILDYPFDTEFIDKLAYVYRSLSRWSLAKVAVRSSVSASSFPGVSFSGIYKTYLNVQGVDELVLAIKKVYLSFFDDVGLHYLKRYKIPFTKVNLAVMVQRLIVPEVSGLAYSFDPALHTQDHFTIEAVYGSGEVIADGEVNPDVYVVDKSSLKITEKKISPQFWMRSFANVRVATSEEVATRTELSRVWHYTAKLTDTQIQLLGRLLKTLDKYYEDFTVEWVFSGSHFYVLQVKGSVRNSKGGAHQKDTLAPGVKFPILVGTPLSRGEVIGKSIVLSEELLERLTDKQIQRKIKNKILVTSSLSRRLRDILLITPVKAVILDTGSVRSDVGFFLEELGVPSIGGTYNATKVIESGAKLHVDANSGSVYLV